jgi:hypothetical protein
MSTGPNTNIAARIGINPGAQTGISNQTGGIIGRAAGGFGVSSGNSTSPAQTGINALSGTNSGVNTNVGAHTGINPGAQTGISNQTGGTAPGLAGSSGNSTEATQIGANARASTNTSTNTNAGAHTASAPASVTILPQAIAVPTRTPLANNDALSPNSSTPGQSPSPLPSASVSPTPTPTPTPVQSL